MKATSKGIRATRPVGNKNNQASQEIKATSKGLRANNSVREQEPPSQQGNKNYKANKGIRATRPVRE